MPIEIMELVIKAKVGDDQGKPTGRAMQPAPKNGPGNDMQKVMDKTVREVMEIIKRKNER